MPTAIPDLWPSDVFTAPVVTPIAVLRRQGEALGAHTQNFVLGDIETSAGADGKQFSHCLYLSAPLLRYRKPLLFVNHGLQPYPATLVEADLTKTSGNYWSAAVANEQELQDRLREFLNEPRVKEVLRSVINLSNDVASREDE